MAYFLPSYFQKRLLRYALGRLDFIDSDALDLDNLGFTIGQRSVIELKNVGIKVSKVVETLDLPSSICPRHASIRSLRVTIPADLHVSGIEVEVDGVDIEVELDETKRQDAGNTRNRRSGAPNRRDIANRPRIASTALHDPGGSRKVDPSMSYIIPAPEDLAASFLQGEPEREKQELQAAVESRSIHVQQSTSQLERSIADAGMGMPEGFSLPGFVTNFFAGIADRLAVKVRHIALTVSLMLDVDSSGTEPVRFVLKVKEVELQSLSQAQELDDLRRHIGLTGIEVLVVSENELFAQKSAATSPKLSRSRSSGSTLFHQSSSLSAENKSEDDSRIFQGFDSSSSESAASTVGQNAGLGVHGSMLGTSQMFEPSLDRSTTYSDHVGGSLHQSGHLGRRDTQSRASSIATSGSSESDTSNDANLAESMMFSHDQAASMYMSAMSGARSQSQRMPGGFESVLERPDEEDPRTTPRLRTSSVNTLRAVDQITASRQSTPMPQLRQQLLSATGDPEARIPERYEERRPSALERAKPVLKVNEASLKIPTRNSRNTSADDMTTSTVRTPRDSLPGARMSSSTVSHSRMPSDQSVYSLPTDQTVNLNTAPNHEVSIGDIEVFLDTSMCYLLIKSVDRVIKVLQPAEAKSMASPAPKTSVDLYAKAGLKSLVVNVMETVPDVAAATERAAPTESTFSVRGIDAPILQLQVLDVQLQTAQSNGRLDQRLGVRRLGLYRGNDKFLSFFDPSALQESFVASSIMVDPDDVVLRWFEGRMDVSTKPMHVKLDLLVIDDVLSRSGGLSSLLDLGASIVSTTSSQDTGLPKSSPTSRRRSVHFKEPAMHPRSEPTSETGLKLNVRISGAIIDLVGSQSSMQIKSSAVKLSCRKTKIRGNISSISVKGPIVRGAPPAEALSVRLGDVSFSFSETPSEEEMERLLHLITPSKDKYEQDDDIMVDTLVRQRRKGSVFQLGVKDVQITATGLVWLQRLSKLGEEISKLSTVTKYLPEDDRPGLLVLGLINKLNVRVELNKQFGPLILKAHLLEGALISIPSLMAAQISSITLMRGQSDLLIHELIPNMQSSTIMAPPMLMCRFIPEEMEPTVKLKLSNTSIEYSVPLLLSVTQLVESLQKDLAATSKLPSPRASELSQASSEASDLTRNIKLMLSLRGSAISLKPVDSPACGLFLFSDAVVSHVTKRNTASAKVDIKKASIMIIDDTSKIGDDSSGADPKLYFDQNDTVVELVKSGFVPVGSISAASANVQMMEDPVSKKQYVDVEFRNNLFFLETCADSTQTLIQILNGLSPPAPPSKVEKYRTQIVPIEDMLASFTGNAFISEKGPELGLQVDESDNTPTPSTLLRMAGEEETVHALDTDEDDETFMNDLYLSQADDAQHGEMAQSALMSQSISSSMGGGSVHIAPVNISADDEPLASGSIMMHSLIDFRTGHFQTDTSVGGTAHRWNSTKNTYGMGSEAGVQQSPLKVKVRDVHIIWNLFDGYDWQNTRDVITHAVREVEDKAFARQQRRQSHRSPGPEEEDESVIGDVLFNSIYISIPTNKDPRELTNAINMELGDAASETGSYATSTTITAATSKRRSGPQYKPKRLRLNRSKQHKMTFELEGLAVDFLAFPTGSGEIESSVDIRIRKLEVFDHVPTSTWKKFATYMHEAGEREVGTDMVHIELLNVKPVAELAASEMVIKLTVLPLRLHVDQDALDFLTRFFEFKDDRVAPSTTPSTPPFLQRVEVNPIQLRLDFKPKRVDYGGLKSGRTTEFMNFFILDRADMVLRRVILYGVSGFDRLGIMLNNIWSPDVRNNQLPGVLAGLAPVRSLVDVGSGVRDLIAVPIREYKKDGRIVRSIQKGAIAFAKTTTTELVNLGAKLAIGTQTVLQNVEGVVSPRQAQARQTHAQTGGTSDSDDEQPHQISNYADQPLGIVQGLRGAYASLERDLLLAKDAIIAVPGEIMAEGSAAGAAKVVLRNSPTIILRPAIGVSKAVGTALLGAGNTLDKGNRRRIEDKYKRY